MTFRSTHDTIIVVYILTTVYMIKITGKKAASAASEVLKDKRTSKKSKTAAGSAMSQREKRVGKK